MNKCKETQNLIDAIIDNDDHQSRIDIQAHATTCEECASYLMTAETVAHDLKHMTQYDADDHLVDATLASILSLQNNSESSHNHDVNLASHHEEQQAKANHYWLKPQWANALAASFMLISLIALFPYNSISHYGLFSKQEQDISQPVIQEQKENGQEASEQKKIKPNLDHLSPYDKSYNVEFIGVELEEKVYRKKRRLVKKSAPAPGPVTQPLVIKQMLAEGLTMVDEDISENIGDQMQEQVIEEIKQSNQQLMRNRSDIMANTNETEELASIAVTSSNIRGVEIQTSDKRQEVKKQSNFQEGFVQRIKEKAEKGSKADQLNTDDSTIVENNQSKPSDQASPDLRFVFGDSSDSGPYKFGESTEQFNKRNAVVAVEKYLSDLQSLEDISYQSATGYWANTYLPGDSQMRLIHSQLLQNKADGNEIIEAISPNIQPFDKPNDAAMAVYLSSDQAFIENQQPTRMRLQVGLQASDRKSGHRPAMNIGLVFDPAQKASDKSVQILKLKALLNAILKAKQPGDSISLTMAGENGGLLIDAQDFRHGPIQVALNNLFTEAEADSQPLSLLQALQLASQHTKKNDDHTSSLGTSMIMLISDNIIDSPIKGIQSLVHDNALNGITLSAVSLTPDNQKTLNQLAMTGQGHSRTLQSVDDAKRVIDETFYASSRAVARALRLRIRLAKGVKLINVLNAYNLNDLESQMVRNTEKSIDQRLSKNLGITSDRGEDEEGIQIVIPSFYAGDTHVILFDVVATNAGAIADVSLRYKDLLYLNNAVSRKQLNLGNQPKSLGPLQFNVMKNTLAMRFSQDIQLASQWLKKGNQSMALKVLKTLRQIYWGVQIEFPHWQDDKEILKDEKLLGKYIYSLIILSLQDKQQISFLIDSLQYISWRKSTSTPM